jgi:hypothetical protein
MYLIVDEYVGFQNTFIAAVRVLHEQKILAKITIEQNYATLSATSASQLGTLLTTTHIYR